MALLITLGFVFAVVMKAPTELFVAYVGPVVTITMAFMWGNAQEHKAQAPNPSNL